VHGLANALDVAKGKEKIQAVAINWPALNFDQFLLSTII